MKKFKDYLLEGFLIIFSVLFALFIENYAQSVKVQKQKDIALERIKMELARNAKILSEWIPAHQEIYNHLHKSDHAQKDSLKNVLMKFEQFNIDLLLNDTQLINTVLANTAWETAKSTGIVAEFDFELTEHLTQVYSFQEIVMNNSIMEIVGIFMDQKTHDLNNLDASLKQLEIRFRELTGQERFLLETYEASLAKLI